MEDHQIIKTPTFGLFLKSSAKSRFFSLFVVFLFILSVLTLGSTTAAEYRGLDDVPQVAKKKNSKVSQAKADSINLLYESLDLISEMASSKSDGLSPIFDESALPPITVEGKLAKIQKEIPLNYNPLVQQFINKYSQANYIQYLSKMKGLGEHYFSIFDRVFGEVGLPLQIKYLSIVESALNPHAVSRVGATGPWQFMYGTAKMYGLQMNKDEDERKDPIAASYAAAAYLLKTYEQFGDWQLAIAAYNCGPGNVMRAIERSGLEKPDFWQIIDFLPKETRNYIPAFIAMTYMMEYHAEFGIEATPSGISPSIEIVQVRHPVRLDAVAKALDLDLSEIKNLNPSYKRSHVPASSSHPKRIILPNVSPENYQELYAVLYDIQSARPEQVQVQLATLDDKDHANALAANATNALDHEFIHRVRKGETLGALAQKYDVTVQDLKVWNGLKSSALSIGQPLKIQDSGSLGQLAHAKVPASNKNSNSKQLATYVVKKGDSLSSIANAHKGATVASLKAANGLKNNNLKPGMKLKIQ